MAPVILTYSASGLLAPGHPCLVEAPPHVPEVGALWDEADVVVAVGQRLRRHDDPGLEDAPAPPPRGDQRRSHGRVEELPAGRGGRGRRRAHGGRTGRPARRARRARCARAPAEGARPGGARADRRRGPGGDRVPRRDRGRAARRRDRGLRHVHPRLLAGRLPPHAGAAQALVPARLGHARVRLPAGSRRRAGRRRPGREHLRATAASCTPAASWPPPSRRTSRSPP